MSSAALIKDALGAGDGVVRLAPCWVPRSFLMPGGRLKLDPRGRRDQRHPVRHGRGQPGGPPISSPRKPGN